MFLYKSMGIRKEHKAAILLRDSVEVPDNGRVRIRKRKPSHPLQTTFEVMLGEEVDDKDPKKGAKEQTGHTPNLNKYIKELRNES